MTPAIDAQGWLSGARRIVSPNCDERPEGSVVDMVVIHSISLPPGRFGGDGVERLFTNRCDPAADPCFEELQHMRVSAHFFIRRDGELVQFVPCRQRAWHAGVSRWQGRERCNDFSIGIELEGGDDWPYEAAQYRSLKLILAQLAQHFPIRHLLGHCHIAPERKTDPGPFFDWEAVGGAPTV
ncbi:1,6-anhydro-N-acetylmuramyl-L-alanine amidase AmpD [Chitinimonas arctica]|uniref:1,6-anhydro-N-acetylmuramyl-L-alanine amidase AmpD n=1 Tax=Chitinimonas arctica TaxID=2594795 RepID=A0A516SGQ0_9NEIS|nr:1,6-anhydro-N-acetylmuramyl-L-alanine amidase AmpD [Chitinimonas arctica]QDQ27280.1 1,6-anhydro-N-acetylmuramyl-L-alanine amidase AmpD [Chitinimonas arctica]